MSDLARRLAERTLSLCQTASPYGEEEAIARLVEAWARSPGMRRRVERIRNSVVVGEVSETRPTVALVGHLDTVPPHEDEALPRLEEDRVVGLGASDMKGALAVIQCLLEDLRPEDTGVEVMAIFYDREEGPHEDSGLKTVLAQRPDLAKLELALVMEPTDGVVQVGCLGSIHATLTFSGKAAHSARPWQGENAITAAGAFLARLHEMKPIEVEVGGHVFTSVATITTAQGGRYRNVVPDTFVLNLNYRFVPGTPLEEAQQRVRELVPASAAIEFTDLAPSGAVPDHNALLERLVSEGGLQVAPKIAWTDVARFTEAGIDAVNFGPGRSDQAHQVGEYCEIAPLARAYEVLSAFLKS
ncbi:MAG: succinyl-diaminopimelate desuccinylase [Deltaproteobacteria bacterium]|nr:succinyl-diaminopimelate desuccinylase [Deltaproteobacteria bacterium]